MKHIVLIGLASLLALTLGLVVQSRYHWLGEDLASDRNGNAGSTEPEILYWVAPMDANFRRDEPGKSPMGMDLVPVYADGAASSANAITISPQVESSLGVRTAVVTSGRLWRRMDAPGTVTYNETLVSDVSLRTAGWVERLAVKSQGESVTRGDVLLELYSPDLVNAQKEYLQASRRGNAPLVAAAAEKLTALGMAAAQVRQLAQRGTPAQAIAITAPQGGVVASLNVREKAHVTPGMPVMRLADLRSVWVLAQVSETQADWVALGQPAQARFAAMPGEVFEGTVEYVYPELDGTSRTLPVRIALPNLDQRIKPNMYAQVTVFGGARRDVLSIPAEALIRGARIDRVVVALGDGQYQAREVVAGMQSGDWVEIKQGLVDAERVVTSAQFLLDSEASIRGSVQRLGNADDAAMETHNHD